MPRDRVLTETDGPFVQVGGRPARPPDAVQVVEYLARLWQTTAEAARETIADNFRRL
jgi:TatD DNase family protein